uniref:SFRICE_013407 n=1 Tax=Spodoptera frugiperda TaxID=7108 RepID=A0A2H1X0B6_SPOFR
MRDDSRLSRNSREIRDESRRSQFVDLERRNKVHHDRIELSRKNENRQRELVEARSQNVLLSRNRDQISMMDNKMESEKEFNTANWQYVLYTLQAAYLCALFLQLLKPSHTGKSHIRSFSWLPVSSHYNPIKVD